MSVNSSVTLTFAVLSSSLGGEGVVTRLQKVNEFETWSASPDLYFKKV